MGAILDERDLIGPAIFGDTVNIECDVPADVYDVSERRLMPLSLLDEVRVRTAQVFAIAVVEFDTCPGTQRRSRGRKKCVGRTQDGLAGHLEEIENGGSGAGPVVEPNRWQFVPRFLGRLELFKFGDLAPVISTPPAEIGRASCRERVCQYV